MAFLLPRHIGDKLVDNSIMSNLEMDVDSPIERAAMPEEQKKSLTVCVLYRKGNCPYGVKCRFLHVPESDPVAIVTVVEEPAVPRDDEDKKERPPCLFFVKGNCRFGDACNFRHDQRGIDQLDVPVCNFFVRGQCRFGDQCINIHEAIVPVSDKKKIDQATGSYSQVLGQRMGHETARAPNPPFKTGNILNDCMSNRKPLMSKVGSTATARNPNAASTSTTTGKKKDKKTNAVGYCEQCGAYVIGHAPCAFCRSAD